MLKVQFKGKNRAGCEVGYQVGYLGTPGRQPSSEDHMSDSNGLENSGPVV